MSLSDKIIQVRGRTPVNEMNGLFDAEVVGIIDVRAAVKELKDRNDTCGCPCCNSWAKDIDEIFGSKLT